MRTIAVSRPCWLWYAIVSASAYRFASSYTPKRRDRKSTRLNSSHQIISYAVFCLKKKEHTSELQAPDHRVFRLQPENRAIRTSSLPRRRGRDTGQFSATLVTSASYQKPPRACVS